MCVTSRINSRINSGTSPTSGFKFNGEWLSWRFRLQQWKWRCSKGQISTITWHSSLVHYIDFKFNPNNTETDSKTNLREIRSIANSSHRTCIWHWQLQWISHCPTHCHLTPCLPGFIRGFLMQRHSSSGIPLSWWWNLHLICGNPWIISRRNPLLNLLHSWASACRKNLMKAQIWNRRRSDLMDMKTFVDFFPRVVCRF